MGNINNNENGKLPEFVSEVADVLVVADVSFAAADNPADPFDVFAAVGLVAVVVAVLLDGEEDAVVELTAAVGGKDSLIPGCTKTFFARTNDRANYSQVLLHDLTIIT